MSAYCSGVPVLPENVVVLAVESANVFRRVLVVNTRVPICLSGIQSTPPQKKTNKQTNKQKENKNEQTKQNKTKIETIFNKTVITRGIFWYGVSKN